MKETREEPTIKQRNRDGEGGGLRRSARLKEACEKKRRARRGDMEDKWNIFKDGRWDAKAAKRDIKGWNLHELGEFAPSTGRYCRRCPRLQD